jgi:hypothetical protein
VALKRANRVELDLCSGLFVGAVTAQTEGSGISHNEAKTRSHLALPLELSLAEFSPRFGWEVSATALVGLAHRSFQSRGCLRPIARGQSARCGAFAGSRSGPGDELTHLSREEALR